MLKSILTVFVLICVSVILQGQDIYALLKATDPTPFSQKRGPDTIVLPSDTLVFYYTDSVLVPVGYPQTEYIEKVPVWTLEKILILLFVSIVGILLIVRLVQDIRYRWQIRE